MGNKIERKKVRVKPSAFAITAIIMVPVCILIGLWIGDTILKIESLQALITTNGKFNVYGYLIKYGAGAIFGIVGLILSAPIYLFLSFISRKVEGALVKYSSKEVLMGMIGLLIGIVLAVLIALLLNLRSGWAAIVFNIVLAIVLGYLGMRIGSKILYDVLPATNVPRPAKLSSNADLSTYVLDASCLIDGRVLDVVRTGFLTGLFVIPTEVLNELSRVADNTDELKRNRGRRGLDIVTALQKEKNISVSITNADGTAKDVDDAVIMLATNTKARIITGDSNLAKFALAQNLEVMNINDLSSAIRPIALPGEKMTLKIVKRGKEPRQGVAFAPDGTMIVVEDGGTRVGETLEVTVTTSLQTSGGRLIFTRIEMENALSSEVGKTETRRF